jgi:hypothetical protein
MPLEDAVFAELNTAKNREVLRTSRVLTPAQWDALWEKNLPARIASNLVDYDLTPAQFDLVLKDEKRGSVLVSQFARPHLTSQQQLEILTYAKGSQYVYQALASGRFDPQHLDAAAEHFRGIARLEWLSFSNSISATDSTVFEALVYCTTPEGYRHARDTMGFYNTAIRILEERNKVLTLVMQLDPFPQMLRIPLAGSRLIAPRAYQERLADLLAVGNGELDLLAFIANPVVHVDLVTRFTNHSSELVQKTIARRLASHGDLSLPSSFDTLEDPNHIEWVLRRALPTERRPTGRPHDLVLLAKNPHMVRVQATRLHATLRKVIKDLNDGNYIQSVRDSSVNDAFALLKERFNLPVPATAKQKHFWEELMNSKNRFYGHTFPGSEWLLDPTRRPWSRTDVDAAYAAITPAAMTAIQDGDLTVWRLPTVEAHAYMVHEFGSDPKRWQMAIALSATHLGSLAKLTSVAKRLAR